MSLSDGSRRFDSVFRNNFCQPPRFFLPYQKKMKIHDFVLIPVQIRLEKVMIFRYTGPGSTFMLVIFGRVLLILVRQT